MKNAVSHNQYGSQLRPGARNTTAAGKDTWNAAEWAEALLLALVDWGIPRAIISERDPKFLSELWKAIFKSLGTELLLSTAYHSQTDEQSERINQTIEIALRFHIACFSDDPWDKFSTHLRGTLNNSTNVSTGQAPNETIYGMKLHDGSDITNVDARNQTEVVPWRHFTAVEVRESLREEVVKTTTEEIRTACIRELSDQIRHREETRIRSDMEREQVTKAEELAAQHQEVDQIWEQYNVQINSMMADLYEGTFEPTKAAITSSCFRGYRNDLNFNHYTPHKGPCCCATIWKTSPSTNVKCLLHPFTFASSPLSSNSHVFQ